MSSVEGKGSLRTCGRIVARLMDAAREARVDDVRVGLGYTAVRLEDGRTGLAYTFREAARRGCSVFGDVWPLCPRSAADLLALLESDDPLLAGLGLACANAIANGDERATDRFDGDVLDHLDIGPDDDVGMVGSFAPMIADIEGRARSLTIFERIREPEGALRPQAEAAAHLPRCQVALITATAIINHTIDELLAAARPCRRVAILGASTPLLPDVFADRPVSLLSGVAVTEPGALLRVVSQGGGTRLFRKHVRKVNVRVAGVDASPRAGS